MNSQDEQLKSGQQQIFSNHSLILSDVNLKTGISKTTPVKRTGRTRAKSLDPSLREHPFSIAISQENYSYLVVD